MGVGVATGIIQTGRASSGLSSGDGERDDSVTSGSDPSVKTSNPQIRKAASATAAISRAADAAL